MQSKIGQKVQIPCQNMSFFTACILYTVQNNCYWTYLSQITKPTCTAISFKKIPRSSKVQLSINRLSTIYNYAQFIRNIKLLRKKNKNFSRRNFIDECVVFVHKLKQYYFQATKVQTPSNSHVRIT